MSDETPIYAAMMRAAFEADRRMYNLYIGGMEVDDIATACRCETWIVQRAILGAAYGKPQRDVTG